MSALGGWLERSGRRRAPDCLNCRTGMRHSDWREPECAWMADALRPRPHNGSRWKATCGPARVVGRATTNERPTRRGLPACRAVSEGNAHEDFSAYQYEYAKKSSEYPDLPLTMQVYAFAGINRTVFC